ncbi:MAG: phosphotransferase enzyme family protein [Anaerolineae bacterium]
MSQEFYSLPFSEQTRWLEQLARQALEHWPIQVQSIQLIKYRENGVFKVITAEGRAFALRIHRPGYHGQAAIVSELQWMAALASSGIDVPQIVPNRAGELFVIVKTDRVPEARLVDLFEWVAGETVRERLDQEIAADNKSEIKKIFDSVGGVMAQLHTHAAGWNAPVGFERHAWDLEGLVGERPFWGRFWELELLTADQKKLMVATRSRLRDDLAAYGQSVETYGLIHADLNFDNVLIDGGVARVIDFDDAGFGWHLFDITVTLNHVIGGPFETLAQNALIGGYRKQRPLAEAELTHLPMFMVMRACTYLGWMRDRQEVEEIRERGSVLIERACKLSAAYLQK